MELVVLILVGVVVLLLIILICFFCCRSKKPPSQFGGGHEEIGSVDSTPRKTRQAAPTPTINDEQVEDSAEVAESKI